MKHFFAGSQKWVPYDHASDAHCITTFNTKQFDYLYYFEKVFRYVLLLNNEILNFDTISQNTTLNILMKGLNREMYKDLMSANY